MEGLGIGQCLPWLPQAIVLVTHLWVWGWQEPILSYAFRGQWGGVVILPSLGSDPHHWDLKGGPHFLGKFLMGLPATPTTRLVCPHIDHATQSTCSGPWEEAWAVDHARGPSSLLLPAGACALPRSTPDNGQERVGAKVPFCWLTPAGCLLILGQGGNLPHWGVPPCAMLFEDDLSSEPGRAGWGSPSFYRIPSVAYHWGGPALYHQLAGTSCGSLSVLHYVNTSDCLIAHSCHTIHGRWIGPASQCGPPAGWLLPAPGSGFP